MKFEEFPNVCTIEKGSAINSKSCSRDGYLMYSKYEIGVVPSNRGM